MKSEVRLEADESSAARSQQDIRVVAGLSGSYRPTNMECPTAGGPQADSWARLTHRRFSGRVSKKDNLIASPHSGGMTSGRTNDFLTNLNVLARLLTDQ